jgi:hypothetical protein
MRVLAVYLSRHLQRPISNLLPMERRHISLSRSLSRIMVIYQKKRKLSVPELILQKQRRLSDNSQNLNSRKKRKQSQKKISLSVEPLQRQPSRIFRLTHLQR